VSGENVADFSFAAHSGEILGITGLIGSGYESILGLVYGSLARSAGTVSIGGRPVRGGSPRTAIRFGLSYAPADRRGIGSFVTWTVRENLTIPRLDAARVTQRLSERAEESEARAWIHRLDIRPHRAEATFANLSGGNQQKVVIARMLRCRPRALLLDEPTIGVDAGAKSAIYNELRDAAAAGATVVISSSDVEELAELCDRVLVVAGGRPVRELIGRQSPADITRASLIDPEAVRHRAA
jgi:ribose transport system ATP-binding protein